MENCENEKREMGLNDVCKRIDKVHSSLTLMHVSIVCIIILLGLLLISLANPKTAKAEEFQAVEKVSGYIDIRNDFVLPKDGDDITAQSVNILLKRGSFGAFLENAYKSNGHIFTMKSSLLLSKGPWSFLVGASTNSKGADFAQMGVWYANGFGKFKVLVDARNYFSISGQSNGYTDNLFRAMYLVGDKLSIGADVAFDHWWNDGHNLYLVGPRINYQFSKEVGVHIRVSHEWNVTCAGTVETDYVRAGLMYTF